MNAAQAESEERAADYCWAAKLDVEALKPGNVHVFAAGHGMTFGVFLRSATVSAAPLVGAAGSGVGPRVLAAVRATMAAVGCNTNLGILLLAAPLLSAARSNRDRDLRSRVRDELRGLDASDARAVYQAIRLARPGGLGRVDAADVADEPPSDLVAAMRLAAQRDRIAWQYVHDFEDIFVTGAAALQAARGRGCTWHWAAVSCYLRFLAAYPDSHVARKHGCERAESVRREAVAVESRFKACENPADAVSDLLQFDNRLKRAGVNPGTSADLTVATLLANRLAQPLSAAL